MIPFLVSLFACWSISSMPLQLNWLFYHDRSATDVSILLKQKLNFRKTGLLIGDISEIIYLINKSKMYKFLCEKHWGVHLAYRTRQLPIHFVIHSQQYCHLNKIIYQFNNIPITYSIDYLAKMFYGPLTSNSLLSSLGLTLHIILTTLRDSTSTGSGVTDLTDSVTSGDIALGRTGGGNFAINAVNGYIPYLAM